jgi:rod shape-determining protein MreC
VIGTITRIDKEEGALFQSAELTPEVDVGRVEEVLVIQTSYGQSTKPAAGADLLGKPAP